MYFIFHSWSLHAQPDYSQSWFSLPSFTEKRKIWSSTKKVQGMPIPTPNFHHEKRKEKAEKKKKKRLHWISEVFTLIIFKKSYCKYFQNQQALQNIVQCPVYRSKHLFRLPVKFCSVICFWCNLSSQEGQQSSEFFFI